VYSLKARHNYLLYNFDLMILAPSNRRIIGYAVGATLASLMYVGWFMEFTRSDPDVGQIDFGFRLAFASFFWLTEGFALTLFLMIAPWSLVVSAYGKFRRFGLFYFPAAGALIIFILGCTTASISWKPLFVEDQTFLEGAAIAAQRQGLGFGLAGIAFGVCYWLFGERTIPSQKKQV